MANATTLRSGCRWLSIASQSRLVLPSVERLGDPTEQQKKRFEEEGFLLVPQVVDPSACKTIAERLIECFSGRFETGIYPDEWYWREELSRPDVTRHMCNVWKTDRIIATVLLNESIAKFAAKLMNFSSIRMGSDSVWVKPPKGLETSVAFHTDSMYVPFPMITAWLTLDNASKVNGSLEYAVGSHRWHQKEAFPRDGLHGSHYGHRTEAIKAAHRVGIAEKDIQFVTIDCPAGSIVFHHGDSWHGSDKNKSLDSFRRTIATHFINGDVKFKGGEGYIYGRYRKLGQDDLDEAFFPILWRQDGYRSDFINKATGIDGHVSK